MDLVDAFGAAARIEGTGSFSAVASEPGVHVGATAKRDQGTDQQCLTK